MGQSWLFHSSPCMPMQPMATVLHSLRLQDRNLQIRYTSFCCRAKGIGDNCTNRGFGADMQVELINDGPVTIILEKHILASYITNKFM